MTRSISRLSSALALVLTVGAATADGISGGGSGGSISVGDPLGGSCTNGYFLYNNAGALGCSAATSSIGFPQAATSVTSGGVVYGSSISQLSVSALLTNHAIMLGGGAGAAPTVLGSLGTTTTVLHGAAAGAPTFGAVAAADMAAGAAATNIGAGGVTSSMIAAGAAATNIGAGGVLASMLATGAAATNLGFTPLAPANNLSEVTASTARTNLGLGTVSTLSTTGSTSTFLRGDGTFVTPPGGLSVAGNINDLQMNDGSGGLAAITPGANVGSSLAAATDTAGGFATSSGLSAAGSLYATAQGITADAYFGGDAIVNGTSLASNNRNCTTDDINKTVIYTKGGPGAAISNPAGAPTLGSAVLAGAPGGTFFAKVWYDAPQASGAPGTSTASAESTLVVAAGSVLTITSPPMVAGARGWHVGVGTSSGAETQIDDATTYIPIGAIFPMNKAIPPSQGAVPGSNTTKQGYVLETKVDSCSGNNYVLHDAGPSLVTATASGAWTTGSATISLASCPSPPPAVGTTISDQNHFTHANQVIGTFGSCSVGTLTLQANPYTASTNPGLASSGAADVLEFGGTGYYAIGTDNSSVLASLAANNPRAHIILPCGNILLGGPSAVTVALDSIAIEGCGQMGDIVSFGTVSNVVFNRGTMVFLTSPTVIPFTVRRSVTLKGINFLYPGNMGTQPAPQVFPQLFADDNVRAVSGILMRDINVINPFAFFVQRNWSQDWSKIWFDNLQGFPIDTGIDRPNESEILMMTMSNLHSNDFHGFSNAGPGYIAYYASNYANFFVIPGNGDGTNCTTASNGGSAISVTNTTWHGYNHIMHIAGGEWTESKMSNIGSGSNNAFLYETPLGSMSNTNYVTNAIFQTTSSDTTTPTIEIHGTCTTAKGKMIFTNTSITADYGGIQIDGAQMGSFSFTGGQMTIGGMAGVSSPVYLVDANGTNLSLQLTGNSFTSTTSGANYDGIHIQTVKQAEITGNGFRGLQYVLDMTGYSSGPVIASGNSSTGTVGTASVSLGPASAALDKAVVIGINNFDKPIIATPIGNTGVCTASSFVPSTPTSTSARGTFSAAICAGSTIILSSMPTMAHGWLCDAHDLTTPLDAIVQTASAANSVTFNATTAAADTIAYKCEGY